MFWEMKGASAEGAPKRLTYDEIQSKTYMEVKGTGTANQCPTIDGGSETFSFKPGKYTGKKFCFEPTSFTVKADSVSKNAPPDFQNTKLMTRLTYTLDEIEGPFEVCVQTLNPILVSSCCFCRKKLTKSIELLSFDRLVQTEA